MTAQILFFLVLLAAGAVVSITSRVRGYSTFFFLSAFLWGVGVWALSMLLLGLLHLGIGWITSGAALILVTGVLAWSGARRGSFRLERGETRGLATALLLQLGAIVVFSLVNLSFASPDSFAYIHAGRTLARTGWGIGPFYWNMTGFLYPWMQAAAGPLGLEYVYGYVPVMSISFLTAFLWLLARLFRESFSGSVRRPAEGGGAARAAIGPWPFLWLAAVALLFSTPLLRLFFTYLHNNWIAGIYLTMSVMCLWLALRDEDDRWLLPGAILLVLYGFSRLEAMYVALVPVVLLIDSRRFRPAVVRRWFLPVALLFLAWSILRLEYSFPAPPGGPYRGAYVVAGLVIFAVFGLFLAFHGRLTGRTRVRLQLPLTVLALAVVVVSAARDWSLFGESLRCIALNMTDLRIWGFLWLLLVPVLVGLGLRRIVSPNDRLIMGFMWIYLLVVIAIAPLRGLPYHPGLFDSGNRMLGVVAPIAVFAALYGLGRMAGRDGSSRTK